MAKIKNTTAYPTVTPSPNDLLIATDVSDNNKTVTFLVSSIASGGGVAQDLQSVLTQGDTAIEDINLTGNINVTGNYSINGTGEFIISGSSGTANQVLAKNSNNVGMVWADPTNQTITWQETLNNSPVATSNPFLTGIFQINDGGAQGTSGLELSGSTFLNVQGKSTFNNLVTITEPNALNFDPDAILTVNSSFGTAGQFLSVNAAATGMEWTGAPTQSTPVISAVLNAGNDTLGQSQLFTGNSTLSLDVSSNILANGSALFRGNNTFSASGTALNTAAITLTGTLYAGISGTGLNGQVLTCLVDSSTGDVSTQWSSAGGSQSLQEVLNIGGTANSSGINIASIGLTGNGSATSSATNGVLSVNAGTLKLDEDTELSLNGDVGTAGYSLVSGGPFSNPVWQNISGGGGSGTVTSVTGFNLPTPTNNLNYIEVSTNMASPTPVITTNLVVDGSVTPLGTIDGTYYYNALGKWATSPGADWNFGLSKIGTVVTVALNDNQPTPRTTNFTLTEGTGISLTQSGTDVVVAYSGSAGITSLGLTSTTLNLTQTGSNTNPATANGLIDVNLSTSGVGAASYTNANITVDAFGRITAASDGGADANTTYTVDIPAATTNINLKGSDGTDDSITLVGGTNVTLTRDSASQITINAASSAGMTSWLLASETGASETVTNGETVTINGGTYIDGVVSATNTIQLDLNATGLPGSNTGSVALVGDNSWANIVKSIGAPQIGATNTGTNPIGTVVYDAATAISTTTFKTYGGGNALGIVPSGGGNLTFLRGDGVWATPAGSGTVTTVGVTIAGDAFDVIVTNPSTTPLAAFTWAGTSAQYITGEGNLATLPTATFTSLTTTGTTGVATLNSGVLNVPNYSPGVTSVGLLMPAAFTISDSPVTSAGTITVTGAGTSAQYIDGTGALQTFSGGGGGTVTEVSLGTLSGITGTVTTGTTNAIINLTNSDKGSVQNIFKNIAVSGQSTIVADTNNDTLTLEGAGGIVITTVAGSDKITFTGSAGTVQGTGTAGFISRFATGGANIEDSIIYNDTTNNLIGINAGTSTAQGYTLTVGDDNSGSSYINIKNTTNNIRIGSSQSVLVETDATKNTILGKQAGQAITEASENVVVGFNASATSTVQTKNVIIGANAMSDGYGGSDVAVGSEALQYAGNPTSSPATNTATGRVAIGVNALEGTSSARHIAINVVAIGSGAGQYSSSNEAGGGIFIGQKAGNHSVNNQTKQTEEQIAIGVSAMEHYTSSSIAIGPYAMRDVTAGTSVILGAGHIAIGKNAMGSGTGNPEVSGSYNIAIGEASQDGVTNVVADNIAVGRSTATKGTGSIAIGATATAGATAGTSTGNIAIGHQSNAIGVIENIAIGKGANASTFAGSVCIGALATSTDANQFVVGSSSVAVGATVTETIAASDTTWLVKINGNEYKIPMLAI